MDFRILGPLEVLADGRALPLGGAKQRALLALLLLQRNEVVSVDRVIDGLWGEAPPATAAKSVQVYVSRLRRLIREETASSRLITRPPGYLLEVASEELDLARFEQLVDESRRAAAGGEAAAAASALRRALALWRGPPLSDLTYEPFAQNAALRLEEQRLEALEARVEADLALGRAAELVGELSTLVREHPYRERLRASLMLALYRAGRQADALDAYRAARRALLDELGIDPSPGLAELERAILRHDPTLNLPAAGTAFPVTTTGGDVRVGSAAREPAHAQASTARSGRSASSEDEVEAWRGPHGPPRGPVATDVSPWPKDMAERHSLSKLEGEGAPFLHFRDGTGTLRVTRLPAERTGMVIGRSPSVDVVLDWDERVSRVHARLEAVGEDWVIEDAGLSHNGTFVNTIRVQGNRRLEDQDVVQVGKTALVFRCPVASGGKPTVDTTRVGLGTMADAERPPTSSVAEGSDSPIVVRSLGTLEIRRADAVLAIEGPEVRELLALLLAARAPVHRGRAIAWLWPDQATAATEEGWRVTVDALGEVLGRDRVRSDGPAIRLVLGTHDSWDTADLLREGAGRRASAETVDGLRATLAEYAAPAFAEWPEAEWAAEIRSDCEGALRRIRGRLAEALLDDGRPDEALEQFSELAELEPEVEAWHRGLMRCHARGGDTALALRQFHVCRSILRRSRGVDPSYETHTLYLELLGRR